VEQELLTLLEHLSSSRFVIGFVLLDLLLYRVCFVDRLNLFSCFKEDFEDTKGVIRSRTSKKDKQHNGQKKRYNDL
jgi:hypothetical protein